MRFRGLPLTGVARSWGLRVSKANKRREVIEAMICQALAHTPQQADLQKPSMNNVCYVLIGERRGNVWVGRLQQPSEGQPSQVAFDWAQVLVREESFGDVLGFYHTHPTSAPFPSQRDVRTMQAWVDSFGKPLLCVIQSGELLAGYMFDQAGNCIPLRPTRFARNILVAVE